MDNMRYHHVKAVREMIENVGMVLKYLPSYIPDLNHIEKMWSKIKTVLRGLKVRTISEFESAVQNAFCQVSQSDCIGWFAFSVVG